MMTNSLLERIHVHVTQQRRGLEAEETKGVRREKGVLDSWEVAYFIPAGQVAPAHLPVAEYVPCMVIGPLTVSWPVPLTFSESRASKDIVKSTLSWPSGMQVPVASILLPVELTTVQLPLALGSVNGYLSKCS